MNDKPSQQDRAEEVRQSLLLHGVDSQTAAEVAQILTIGGSNQ